MGERAVGHEATSVEIEAMNALLRASLGEGGMGFSSTRSDMPDVVVNQLSASDYAAERGAVVLALTMPQEPSGRVNLLTAFAFDAIPRWAEVLRLPVEARKKALADPAVREQLPRGGEEQGPGPLKALTRWAQIDVQETFEPENHRWQGRKVGDVAAERGIDPPDSMLDLSLSEGLRTPFGSPTEGQTDAESWRMRAESWTDPRTIVGASDAGAHLDMMDTFAFSTQLLGRGFREMDLISVEAEGIDHVLVNGREIVREGRETGTRPGTMLRSGRETETVANERWNSMQGRRRNFSDIRLPWANQV